MYQETRKERMLHSNKGSARKSQAEGSTSMAIHQFKASDFRLIANIQRKKNNTGLSDQLKSGIESMSGYSMDDVKAVQCKRTDEELKKASCGEKVVQRALAVDDAGNELKDESMRKDNRTVAYFHWVRAQLAKLGRGEDDCKNQARFMAVLGKVGEKHDLDENTSIWLNREVNGKKIYVNGYVIKHQHDFIHAGKLKIGKYKLNSSSSNSMVTTSNNNPAYQEEPQVLGFPHYHGADLNYLCQNYQGKYIKNRIVSAGIEGKTVEQAENEIAADIVANTHGATGHHIFDKNTLLQLTP